MNAALDRHRHLMPLPPEPGHRSAVRGRKVPLAALAITLIAATTAMAQNKPLPAAPLPAGAIDKTVNPGSPTNAIAAGAAARPATVTLPLPAGCSQRSDAIGLSRVVEIDTTGGPRLGHSQYKDIDFLKEGEVVLTFDDGPLRRYTKPILDTLDRHCTRATFFAVGRMAIADPETLKDTWRRGHTVASHTWSHAKLSSIGFARAKAEIELGNSAVTKALGQPIAPFFRFPYLRDSKAALDYVRSRDMSAFSIEVDSQDFRTRNPGQVLRNVMSQLKVTKKGILLFHDIQPATAGALDSILDALKSGGYKVVHVIPKTANTTLPEYDAMADQEIEKRRLSVASVSSGVAGRAITAGAKNDALKVPPPSSSAKTAAPPVETLPWATSTTPATELAPADAKVIAGGDEQPAPPPLKRPLRRPIWQGIDEDPWRIKTLGE